MTARLSLSDAQIRSAIERRSTHEPPPDLRGAVLAAAAAEPQRRSWWVRLTNALPRFEPRRSILVLATIALLVAAAALVLAGIGYQARNNPDPKLGFITGNQLWIADADGAHARLVWDPAGSMIPSQPTWVDPDRMLVRDGRGGVYAVDVLGSAPRLLAKDGALLAVSPDHLRVAVGFERPDGPHLSVFEIASGQQVSDAPVTPAFVLPATPQIGPQYGLTGGPHAWSPDGRWLLGQGFDGSASDTSGWIYQLDVQTGEIRDLATGLCCGLHKPNPVLAPDGSRVVYMAFHDATQGERCNFRCGTLWALDPVTLARQRLTEEAGSEVGPVFSPDGSRIAFAEYIGPGYDIGIVRSDGTDRRRLTDIGDVYAPVANIEPYVYLAWDQDGGGLTFMRGPGDQAEWQLWHVTLEGDDERVGTFVVSEFSRTGGVD